MFVNVDIGRKMLESLLYGSIFYYFLSYGSYLLFSKGLDDKSKYLQMRRYVLCSLLATLPFAISEVTFKTNLFIVVTGIAILWMCIYPYLYRLTNVKTFTEFDFRYESVFSMFFVCAITSLAILSKCMPVIFDFVVCLISLMEFIVVVLLLVQIVYFFMYKSSISKEAIQLIQQTHYNEVLEFFKSLSLSQRMLYFSFLVTTLYGIFVANYSFVDVQVSLSDIDVICISLLFVYSTRELVKKNGLFKKTGIITSYFVVKDYLDRNLLYSSNTQERIKNLNVEKQNVYEKPHTIILVIGESASRDHMKVFNDEYDLDNTPWMTSNKEKKNCLLFRNAFSVYPNTVIALERALTEFNQYDNNDFFSSCSIVDIAHKAGYKVHWYSNQGHLGAGDTSITLVASTADVAKWTEQKLNQVQYDEELLSYLDEVDATQNNFVVLHLKGSHFIYLNRYPKEFTRFGEQEKYDLRLNYANTIAYTDNLLEKIYEYGNEKLNLQAMIYCSDHGEKPLKKRSPNLEDLDSIKIPLMVFLSDTYISNNNSVYNALSKNIDKYWTNDLLYELVCGIINIKSNRFKEENSIASDKYKFTRETLRVNMGKAKL